MSKQQKKESMEQKIINKFLNIPISYIQRGVVQAVIIAQGLMETDVEDASRLYTLAVQLGEIQKDQRAGSSLDKLLSYNKTRKV